MKANPSHFQRSFWHGMVGFLVFTWEMYSYSLMVIYSYNLLWPHFILGCPKLWTFWRVDQLLNSHGKVASLLLTLYGVCTPNVNWSWAVSWLQLCWRSIQSVTTSCVYILIGIPEALAKPESASLNIPLLSIGFEVFNLCEEFS